MKTFVATVDLEAPAEILWGTKGYGSARLLVRSGRQPLGEVTLGLDPNAHAVPPAVLEDALADLRPVLPMPRAAADPARPPISVVVCTRDRAGPLRRCLAQLARLRYPTWEAIVVDNASRDDATREAVAATAFRYVREDTPGLDWARNRGIAEARYDIVAYVDDDAFADEHWLEGLAHGFRDPAVGAVTGLVLPAELETRSQHLFEDYGGMGKGFRPRRFSGRTLSPVQLLRAQDVGVGTNMAFRREVLERLGGFDTALDVGTPACGGGDLDMLHRVLADGGEILYEPGALVRHQHRRDDRGLETQVRNNGRSYGVYLIKRFREGRVPRRKVLWFAAWHWGRWLAGRPLRRLLRGHRLPMRLLLAELSGALGAPLAWRRTCRRDLELRQARG